MVITVIMNKVEHNSDNFSFIKKEKPVRKSTKKISEEIKEESN